MKIFFDHIPKTAGTSLRFFFAEAFGEENVSLNLKGMKLSSALSLYGGRRVIIGHFGFAAGERLPEGYFSATLLRDPRERTLSNYYFIVSDVPDAGLSPLERKIKSIPIEQAFLDDEIRSHFYNLQALHFAGFFSNNPRELSSSRLFDSAKEGLEQYDLVGISENIDDFVKALKSIFDIPPGISIKHYNATSSRKGFSELPSSVQKSILECVEIDLQLWNHAGRLLQSGRRHSRPNNEPSRGGDRVDVERKADSKDTDDGSLEFLEVGVNSRLRPGLGLLSGEEAVLTIIFLARRDVADLAIGYRISHDSGLAIFGTNTLLSGYRLSCQAGKKYRIDFVFTVNLGLGRYYVAIGADSGFPTLQRRHFYRERAARFGVEASIDLQFEGLARLMPSVHLSEEFLATDAYTSRDAFKRIGYLTPVVSNPVGNIRSLAFIPVLRPGQQFSIMIEISNQSEEDWIGEGNRPVHIGYHWKNGAGSPIIYDSIRTPLPSRILPAGQITRTGALVEAPEETGELILELTLVQESVCWFEDRGFESAKINVRIEQS